MFKKIYIYVACIFIISILCLKNNSLVLNGDNHFLYLNEASSNARIVPAENYSLLKKVYGESCEINRANFDLDKTLNQYNAKFLFSEEVENIIIYYAYSEDIKYFLKINNVTVNLEIAVSKNLVTLGSPIIFGSF